MAGGGGESLSDTPDWRIAVLVAAFIVITLVWEKLMDKLNRHLSAKHRLGLRHIVHKLEEELLALGLISLLLIALQVRWCDGKFILLRATQGIVQCTTASYRFIYGYSLVHLSYGMKWPPAIVSSQLHLDFCG